jgi:hypothetical protein
MVELRQIAHARSGDKGDSLTITLIPYDEKDYDILKTEITEERVKEHFSNLVFGPVKRYEAENIKALHYVLYKALDGGVTRSLRLDRHGKTLSSKLLEMEIKTGR